MTYRSTRHNFLALATIAVSTLSGGRGFTQDAARLLDQLKSASPSERPVIVRKLGELGAAGLTPTRSAREATKDAALQRALDRAITWQAAARVTKTLRAGLETQLTFDGQYTDLKKDRETNLRALFALVDDESTSYDVRIASCRGIADIGSPADLPRLRKLHSDLLLPPTLREEIGILLAIFGDTHAVDRELKEYKRFVDSKRPEVRLSANLQLANMYYRIRNYESAVDAYEKILETSKQMYELRRRAGFPKEFLAPLAAQRTLHFYNAACSNSLHGDLERAKKYLRKAVEGNPEHFENIDKDGDLIRLRKDPSYKKFKEELGRMFEDEEL